jgi:hypothetical protein
MHEVHEVAEAVDDGLSDGRSARIQRDAARVNELAVDGFKGRAYQVFEDELIREAWPILRGMLRAGTLARIALKWCAERGLPFWIGPDDYALLRSDPAARDEILVDVVLRARVSFRLKALVEGGWNPNYKKGRGASCLTTYFVGQCIWEFRRVYTRWAKDRQDWAQVHALYDGSEEAAYANPGLFGPLLEAGHLSEPEAAVLSTNFEDILREQPPLTQAVIGMVVEGFVDTEIADALHMTHAAVRMRKTRFPRRCTTRPARGASGSPSSSTPRPAPATASSGVRRDRAAADVPDARAGHVHPLLQPGRPHRVRHRPPGQGPGGQGDRLGKRRGLQRHDAVRHRAGDRRAAGDVTGRHLRERGRAAQPHCAARRCPGSPVLSTSAASRAASADFPDPDAPISNTHRPRTSSRTTSASRREGDFIPADSCGGVALMPHTTHVGDDSRTSSRDARQKAENHHRPLQSPVRCARPGSRCGLRAAGCGLRGRTAASDGCAE